MKLYDNWEDYTEDGKNEYYLEWLNKNGDQDNPGNRDSFNELEDEMETEN